MFITISSSSTLNHYTLKTRHLSNPYDKQNSFPLLRPHCDRYLFFELSLPTFVSLYHCQICSLQPPPTTSLQHTPSTTTLNAWFCQAFPSLGGSRVLLWLHSIPFLSVRLLLQVYLVVLKLSLPLSIDFNRWSTQQLATRSCTPVIEAYNMAVNSPVCEVQDLSAQSR